MHRFFGKHSGKDRASLRWAGLAAVLLLLMLLNLVIQYSDLELTYHLSYRRGVSQLTNTNASSTSEFEPAESTSTRPFAADFVVSPGQAVFLSVIGPVGQGEITLNIQAARANGRLAPLCEPTATDCAQILPESSLEK